MDNESVFERQPLTVQGIFRQLLIILSCLAFSSLPAFSAGTKPLSLTPEELSWLDKHPVIEIGVCGECPPIDFITRDDVHRGMIADYLNLIADRLGVRFQATRITDPPDLAGRPFEAGPKVIVTESTQTEGAQARDFSAHLFIDYQVIVTRSKNAQEYTGLADLSGKTVVIEKDATSLEWLRAAYPGLVVKPVESTLAALRAVSRGDAFAYIGSEAVVSWMMQEHQIAGLVLTGDARLQPMRFRFAVVRDAEWSPLLGLFNKVLSYIDEDDRLWIRWRWLPIGIETARPGTKIELTADERTWLDQHPDVRLGIDPAWPPIEFFNEEQEYLGVTSEYIGLISKELKLRMSPIKGDTWSDVIALAQKGEVDLLPAVGKTSERTRFLNFTKPYLTFPFVVYTREDAPFINGLEDLAGKRVAVEDAYAFRAVLERDYPNLQLVLVDTPLDGLSLLSNAKVDAYTGNLAVGSYLINKEALSHLKVGAPTPYRFELRMGVRKDWPELLSILQKMLDGMSDEEKFAIRQKWLQLQHERGLNTTHLWRVLLGSSLILCIAGIWILQMRNQREALRHSEERYHLAMEAVSEAVWEWDLRTDKRYFSPGFFYHLDYREQEIPASETEWLTLIHPEDVEYYESSVKRRDVTLNRDGRPLVLEFRVRTRQGGYVEVQSIGKEVEWDETGRAVLRRGTLRDISAQKQFESELRKLSQAVENSPVMVIITDSNGNIEYVNPKFTEVTGYTASEAYGRNPRFLQSGLTNKKLYEDLWRTISAGKEWRGEIQDRKKNGEIFWESISISVVRNLEGEITHYVGIKEDITARKEAERLLATAKEEAEQANRFKSNFLANMSHEIRTPMNAIIGLTHLTLQSDLNPRQTEYLKKIKSSAQSLLGIINDILDFSKIEAGKLMIEEAPFQLDQVLENLLGLVALRAEDKGLELILKRDDKVPNDLVGDPLRLGQILLNLVQNAIKFTERGKVEVAVTLENMLPDRVSIAFSVSDTGIGIETERMPRLFKAFEQVDSSSSRQHGGAGLGLSICKQLVELMHGELSVKSTLGQGSHFGFVLQLGRQTNKPCMGLTQIAPYDDRCLVSKQLRGKVLLVEDNATNQLVARELLESFGLQVVIADEGETAMRYLAEENFDLVLMDIQMPGMDGYVATRSIRADKRHARLPIIAMTAHAMEGDKEDCLAAGMNDYLSKPVDPDRLYRVLKDWLVPGVSQMTRDRTDLAEGLAMPESFEGIELAKGLRRIGGNRRLFVKLLNDFYHQYHNCCEQIGQALAEGSIEEAHLLAHTLQGVAGNIGCRELEIATKEMGLAIKRQASQEIAAAKEKFCIVAKSTFKQLASLLAQWDSQGANVQQWSRMASSGIRNVNLDIIQELSELLREGDPNANTLLDSLHRAGQQPVTALDEQIQHMQRQVADYNYDEALITLQQLTDIYLNKNKSENHGRA